MKKKWMAGLHLKKGALRATAARMGLVHGDQKLSPTILGKIDSRSSDPTTHKRVALARTFAKARG